MSVFTNHELAYLMGERRLARIATVGKDGTPHVVPVGWSYNRGEGTIDIGGLDLARTKKYRDVQGSGRAAVVIDDIASVDPWRVRGVEVRGRAEALSEPRPLIRIHPDRVVSWGIESDAIGKRQAQTNANRQRAGEDRGDPSRDKTDVDRGEGHSRP
jgi:pyridoxamine 5'-phosphate oxidase family protein